ncbi:helix-turn-helix transcriptional regulator [Streptomyces sp. NPDC059017]|uniref:helix-turn-helix transcriptional regulator n=1 Tax=Streptomyces sp. NPDC059017 TaxID=3346700 RepID=UPI0036866BC0
MLFLLPPLVEVSREGDERLDADHHPTLAEIRSWAATVDVARAARAVGISKSHLYELIKRGNAPFRVVVFGKRYRVITASLIAYLEQV